MFTAKRSNSTLGSTFSLLELVFHLTARRIRGSSGNAIVGLLSNMVQAIMMVAIFYLFMNILGMRRATPIAISASASSGTDCGKLSGSTSRGP